MRDRAVFLCLVAIALSGLLANSLHAQITAPADTSKTAQKPKQIRPGIQLPDSLYIARDSIKGDVDTIVRYMAKDSTIFDVPNKRMILVNKAQVNYQNRELDAHTIVMDFQHNTLTAYSSSFDSVISSTMALQRRIIRDTNRTTSRGAPKLTEGGTVYEGEVIVYNFKTKRGTVQLGTTEMEGGFYYGEKIKQVAPKTLFVENGRYTTCDAPTPHYYFESPKMKVIMGDQVFAEPVYLYVADVPIFALPFGVFPNHGGGRHSGIVAPSYQTQGDRGWGLTHGGYYWVVNDYLDARAQGDIYTKGGYNVDLLVEGMKRYLLNSPASIEYGFGETRFNSSNPYTHNWLLRSSLPNLSLGYETQLSANLSFESDGYFQNNATNVQQYFTQTATSSATFNTGWADQGIGLSLGYSRLQNLQDGSYDEESPSFNFTKSTWFPFQSTTGENVDPTLASLGIGYTLNADHHLRKITNTPGQLTDTTKYTFSEQYGILHNPSISISPKLGHFAVTPSFNYQEAWLVREHEKIPYLTYVTDSTGKVVDSVTQLQDVVHDKFNRLYTYSAGVNVSTTLYGIANIGAFGIEAVRHTIIPSIALSYHPDLSSQNYSNYYIDPKTGQRVYYNKYDGEPNGGLVGQGKSAAMTMSLSNDFEAKVERTVSKDSTTVDHVKLFHLDASSGYDMVTKILSGLHLSGYSSIGTFLSISGNADFSFYPTNYVGTDSTEAGTLISLHQGFLRPQTVSASLTGSFSASTTVEGENYDSIRRLFHITSPEDERALFLGGFYPGPYMDIPFRPKWNFTYGLTYQQSFAQPLNTEQVALERDFGATVSLSLPLTVNWLFTTTAQYDLTNKKIIIPQLTVHRDLHCWEMNFSYRPPGSQISGFNLEIKIKAPQLQDIKLTRTENTYGEF